MANIDENIHLDPVSPILAIVDFADRNKDDLNVSVKTYAADKIGALIKKLEAGSDFVSKEHRLNKLKGAEWAFRNPTPGTEGYISETDFRAILAEIKPNLEKLEEGIETHFRKTYFKPRNAQNEEPRDVVNYVMEQKDKETWQKVFDSSKKHPFWLMEYGIHEAYIGQVAKEQSLIAASAQASVTTQSLKDAGGNILSLTSEGTTVLPLQGTATKVEEGALAKTGSTSRP